MIDTIGEGFRFTDLQHGVMFEWCGNGVRSLTSWTAVGSKNAWLVLPDGSLPDISGRITAKQLFGNLTPQPKTDNPNGFLALAVYDSNGDGVIDKQDPVFAKLRLWIDENHDGLAQPSELFTLPSLGVDVLSLKYMESKYVDQYGNAFRYRARIQDDTQHSGRWAYDVFLLVQQ